MSSTYQFHGWLFRLCDLDTKEATVILTLGAYSFIHFSRHRRSNIMSNVTKYAVSIYRLPEYRLRSSLHVCTNRCIDVCERAHSEYLKDLFASIYLIICHQIEISASILVTIRSRHKLKVCKFWFKHNL